MGDLVAGRNHGIADTHQGDAMELWEILIVENALVTLGLATAIAAIGVLGVIMFILQSEVKHVGHVFRARTR